MNYTRFVNCIIKISFNAAVETILLSTFLIDIPSQICPLCVYGNI